MHFKAIYVHLIMALLGLLAYAFADVDSQNGFFSLLLPILLVLTILYFITLLIYLIHQARHTTGNNEHVGLLSEAVQELGKRSDIINLESVLARTSVEAAHVPVSQTAAIPTALATSASRDSAANPSGEAEDDQDDINLDAWEDDTNWTGPSWFAVYFSKNDSRSWVPKRIPILGWTPNLGQSVGFLSWLIIWSCVTAVCVMVF